MIYILLYVILCLVIYSTIITIGFKYKEEIDSVCVPSRFDCAGVSVASIMPILNLVALTMVIWALIDYKLEKHYKNK